MRRGRARGFTLLEMMVVVAIVVTLATMAWSAFGRQKPRQTLNGFALELRALVLSARQNAFATGKRTLVLVFPDQATGNGTGRLVVYQDGDASFFSSAAAVNFGNFKPASPAAGARGEIVEVLDLPAHVTIGPAAGQGTGATMRAPFDGIAIDTRCGFCTGAGARGAIAFDPAGGATFHSGNGAALERPSGASLSVTADDAAEVRTLAVAAATGALETIAGAL